MKSTLILLFASFAFSASANHLKGGEISYDYLGDNMYLIHLTVYRDYNSNSAPFDDPGHLTIYDANGVMEYNMDLFYNGSSPIPRSYYPDLGCQLTVSDTSVEVATYTTQVLLQPISGGYTVAYQRCCTSSLVINTLNPESNGLTLTCHIPGSVDDLFENNSARRLVHAPFYACKDVTNYFDMSSTDPDGDLLVYSLFAPYIGANDIDPAPSQAPPPPYSVSSYELGFSPSQPMGSESVVQLDPVTGLLTLNPSEYGGFLMGVKTTEFRNGEVIGQYLRTFEVRVETQYTVSIETNGDDPHADIKTYPNPTNDLILIDGLDTHGKVTLHSLDGSMLIEQTGDSTISLRHLPQGCYLLAIKGSTGTSVYKVTKQ